MKKFLRKFLDERLEKQTLKPLFAALDSFFFETNIQTTRAPFIRDGVDLKRWMTLVIFALLPCIAFGVWNTGVQSFVYGSKSASLFQEYTRSCHSVSAYLGFVFFDGHFLSILKRGLQAFVPIMIVSYASGGLCEAIFSCVRKKPIAEGFLVTGMLVALIVPPTIPYWMLALCSFFGVLLSKELFGGTGMNFINPALCCRALLFFSFPMQMTGDVWIGTHQTAIRESCSYIRKGFDGITQATPLSRLNISHDIKRIHVDAILARYGEDVQTKKILFEGFDAWAKKFDIKTTLSSSSNDEIRRFVTEGKERCGLGLAPERYDSCVRFAELCAGRGILTDGNFFFGNRPGCIGETSLFACLLGALFLVVTGVGSWRIMVGVLGGAFCTASLFQWCAEHCGVDGGLWNSAIFAFPAYKHLLLGGLGFGAVFMATDPVSAPTLRLSRWIYGIFIGCMTIVTRTLSPAYPEGVMLAILLGNVVAPLIDTWVARLYRRGRLRRLAFSTISTLLFVMAVSMVAAITLSLVAVSLRDRKKGAKEVDRQEQLLVASKILGVHGEFQGQKATPREVLDIYKKCVKLRFVDSEGAVFEKEEPSFFPLFFVYDVSGVLKAYVVPIAGFGLWDKIYGFLAIQPDGKTVEGTTWYDHKETPGLGGDIATPTWQSQFYEKWIFQPDEQGAIDPEKSPLGITVVKGKVSEVLGKSEKAKNSVDGIAGATLTGNGVTQAYKNSLRPYRPFFKKLLTDDGAKSASS